MCDRVVRAFIDLFCFEAEGALESADGVVRVGVAQSGIQHLCRRCIPSHATMLAGHSQFCCGLSYDVV